MTPRHSSPTAGPQLWSALFETVASSPFSWSSSAASLWRGGNYILDLANSGAERHAAFLAEGSDGTDDEMLLIPVSDEWANATADAQMFDLGWMLLGLAIENAAKGVLIRKTPGLVGPNGELSKDLTKHDLPQLVGAALESLEPAEEDLLSALASSVIWRGRYPVPKTSAKWASANRLRLGPEDREIATMVFHRLTRACGRGMF